MVTATGGVKQLKMQIGGGAFGANGRGVYGIAGAGQRLQDQVVRGMKILVRRCMTTSLLGKCLRRFKKKFIRLALICLVLILMLVYSGGHLETSDWSGGKFDSTSLKNDETASPSRNPEDQSPVFKTKTEHHPSNLSGPCHFPLLDPFAPQMLTLINMTIFLSNYSCAADPALGTFKEAAFHVERGNILVRDVEFPSDVICCFQQFSRGDDDETVKVDRICNKIEKDATAIQMPTEFLMVTCKKQRSFLRILAAAFFLSKDEIYYRDAFQIFHEKPEVERRIKEWQEESKVKEGDDGRLSVLVFGIDTTSQMQFERGMPKSKLFLEEKLQAVRLMGYNTVGHNSYPNLVPVLCGITREEFEEECVQKTKVSSWFELDFLGGERFDFAKCHFIWKTFAAHGYRTSLVEDDTDWTIFNYPHPNSFSVEPPTDYYYRPYSILMEKALNFVDQCYGPRLSFETLVEHAKAFADMFQQKDRHYFNFVWTTMMTHHSLQKHRRGDKPLLELLHYLHGNGHLNHTALFLLGDHGFLRTPEIEQAKIESRMPIAYILLPTWFSLKYPKAMENLRWNAKNSVTSHFDMHKTILDMMDLDRLEGDDENWRENRYFQPILPEMRTRGQSLFEINANGRDCVSGGIPPMYCPCVERLPLRTDSFLVVKGSQAVIDRVNWETSQFWFTGCENVQLVKVIEATVLLSDKEVMENAECRFLINNATMEEVEQATVASCNNSISLDVRLLAAPHDPIYQAVVSYTPTGDFSINLATDIVRKDWYREKGRCVPNKLRPYCICKSYKGEGHSGDPDRSFVDTAQKKRFSS